MSEQRRALLLPQEVKELGTEEAIVFYEGLRPIRCRKIRYFADQRFRKRLLPAPTRTLAAFDGRRRVPGAPAAATVAAEPEAQLAGEGAAPRVEKEDVVIREGTVEDIERIESLTLEDFATDFSKVPIPDEEGRSRRRR